VVRIAPHTRPWLPGQLLEFLSEGGSSTVGFSRSLLLSLVYLVTAVVVALIVFSDKDVTA
jgi:hypothetical protein